MVMTMEKTGKQAIIIAISIIAVSVFIAALLLYGGNYGKGIGSAHSGESPEITQINKVIPAGHIAMNILSPVDHFVINATVPEMPSTVPYYKDTYQRSDVVDLRSNYSFTVRPNATSKYDAPALAQQALAPYGGLPSDAIQIYSKTSYRVIFNGTTGDVKRRDPVETTILYERNLNGSTIKGMHDMASVTFGNDGEILELTRIWGTIQYSGRDIPVISVYDAIRKLEERDVMNPVLDGAVVTINSTYLGHYGHLWINHSHETYLEPIWIFTGTFPSGSYYEFYVYARQFTNFTATPTSGPAPLNVTFTDTSDAYPNAWYWDFGDGTNSTVQNATHLYESPGSYNVTLLAWNDLGSDTVERPGYIVVS